MTGRRVLYIKDSIAGPYIAYRQERLYDEVSIALVGKYTDLQDSYMSVIKALEHSAFRCQRKLLLKVSAYTTRSLPDLP